MRSAAIQRLRTQVTTYEHLWGISTETMRDGIRDGSLPADPQLLDWLLRFHTLCVLEEGAK